MASSLPVNTDCCRPCSFSDEVTITVSSGWPVVADIAAVRAISGTSIFNSMVRVATSAGMLGDWLWVAGDVTADDGLMVLAPSDGSSGRWFKVL